MLLNAYFISLLCMSGMIVALIIVTSALVMLRISRVWARVVSGILYT